MKNINKNAVQALWLDGKAFLSHNKIDGFAMGQGDFTIETSFICNEVQDCVFYAQDQGFEFGIRNGLLYFELEGMGSITQKEGVSIDTDILLSAAVSCREGKLTLFLEGLPITDQVEVKSEAVENSGSYWIGKGLKGYIVDLRLRSCGMTDQEILNDNGLGLRECELVEFWADFTSVQYRDKSHNALGLSAKQGIVKCVNTASCTHLELQGGYVTMVRKSYGEAYTLLFKIYPQLESYTKMYVYSAVGADDTVFSVGVVSDANGGKHIFVENGGAEYQSSSALPIMAWTDIGLRVDSGAAQLYVDGVQQLEFTFSGKLDNITSIIGVKPFEKKIVCKDGFWGYLDYFAEFNCALSEDKIAYYAEEQPYIFDDFINSLYAFYCGDPIDLVTGNMLLSIGTGKVVFEKELNSLNAPIGMDFRVPQEVCAEWQELDEYEQWATTTAMDMVRETYSLSMGLAAAEGILPIEQVATKQIRELYAEQIEEVKLVWTPENENVYTRSFIKGAFPVAVGGLGTAVVGGMASLAFKAFLGSKALKLIGLSLLVGGGIVIVAGGVRAKEKTNSKKRPENKKGKLRLVSICCNHNGNPEEGSIHFHSDAVLTQPESMTYMKPENGEMSMDMLLLYEKLDGNTIKADVVVKNDSNEAYQGCLKITSDVFIESQSTFFSVPPGGNNQVTLNLEFRNQPNCLIYYHDDTLMFTYKEDNEWVFMIQCKAGIYVQKSEPIAPWVFQQGVYSKEEKCYPSLVFIRNMITGCCNGIQNMDNMEAFNKILNNLYSSEKLRYIATAGHLVNNFNEFDLVTFNTKIENENQVSKTAIDVNCTVCANIVCLIAAQLGINMKMAMIKGYNYFEDSGKREDGFKTKPILAIGNGSKWEETEFSYHQVAVIENSTGLQKNSKVYDLALNIDAGQFPNKLEEGISKEAFLSGGYKAYNSGDLIINITTPYFDEYYLERLVKDEQEAFFLSNLFQTKLVYGLNTPQANDFYTTFMQQYIQSYGLDDEKYANEIPQPEVQSALLQEMGLESKTQMQYEYVWSAPNNKEVTWFCNVEHLSAGEYLASVLMRYSCRLTEKDAPELGERVFYGPDLLITYFAGNAYAIRCKDMEKAEETARRLKDSINQQTI